MSTESRPSRNPAGRGRAEMCSRGHMLSEWRRTWPNGQTYCLACRRLRDRTGRRWNRRAATMERLLRDGLSTTSLVGIRDWQVRVWKFFEQAESEEAAS
jgi:hypothetical protein